MHCCIRNIQHCTVSASRPHPPGITTRWSYWHHLIFISHKEGETMNVGMRTVFARYWWALVIRGIVAILFGLAALFWPGLTLIALVLLFGAYALIDGIFAVVAALGDRRDHPNWGMLLIGGIIGIIIGIITFFWPG